VSIKVKEAAQYLEAYTSKYREEYHRFINPPPVGGGYPSLPIYPYLYSNLIYCYITDNGVAIVDQEPMADMNNQPIIINGVPHMTGGREMMVGDVISSILTTKNNEQFSALKEYALAQRFYMSELTDLDDTDYSSLREIVEKNDQYIPLVLAQVLQVLIEAKDNRGSSAALHRGKSMSK
jgi:hypothetical protein